MAATQLQQLDLHLPEPQGHLLVESHGRPGEAGRNAFHIAKEARKTADFAGLVLFATFDDQVIGVLTRNDLLWIETAGAEHPHRVVVSQHDVPDRFVGDLANAAYHVLGHCRRGLRVGNQHGVIAHDNACVRVSLGGVGVGVFRKLGECDLFLLEVGMGGKFLGCGHVSGFQIGHSCRSNVCALSKANSPMANAFVIGEDGVFPSRRRAPHSTCAAAAASEEGRGLQGDGQGQAGGGPAKAVQSQAGLFASGLRGAFACDVGRADGSVMGTRRASDARCSAACLEVAAHRWTGCGLRSQAPFRPDKAPCIGWRQNSDGGAPRGRARRAR
ncbi:hypothetical protein D3C71_1032040 [compost metagenome]